MPKTPIVIDFDGTIQNTSFLIIGEPTPRVKEALETLKNAGLQIIIHTLQDGILLERSNPEQPAKDK